MIAVIHFRLGNGSTASTRIYTGDHRIGAGTGAEGGSPLTFPPASSNAARVMESEHGLVVHFDTFTAVYPWPSIAGVHYADRGAV